MKKFNLFIVKNGEDFDEDSHPVFSLREESRKYYEEGEPDEDYRVCFPVEFKMKEVAGIKVLEYLLEDTDDDDFDGAFTELLEFVFTYGNELGAKGVIIKSKKFSPILRD